MSRWSVISLNAFVNGSYLLSNREVDLTKWRSCWKYGRIFKEYQTITLDLCFNQFHCLKTALDKNRSSLINWKWVIFHYDDVRTITAHLTKDLLGKITSYSIFPWPCSFWLSFFLKGLQNHLNGLKLISREDVEPTLLTYFALQPKEIYSFSIYNLIIDGVRFFRSSKRLFKWLNIYIRVSFSPFDRCSKVQSDIVSNLIVRLQLRILE